MNNGVTNKELHLPTKTCLVCGCLENPLAKVAYNDSAWLCDKCRAALLSVVERSNENAK